MFSLSKLANGGWDRKSDREALIVASAILTLVPLVVWIGIVSGLNKSYVFKPFYYYPIGVIITFILTGFVKLRGEGKEQRGWLIGLVFFWPGLCFSYLGCLLWYVLAKIQPLICGLHNSISVAHEKISEIPRLFVKRPKLLKDRPMPKLSSEYRDVVCSECRRPK